MKVLKFGAVWCNACLVMKPRWAEIEKEYPQLKTEYFEYDDSKEMVKKYKVGEEVLPVFIFLDKHGREFLRLDGEVAKNKLRELVEKNIDR